MASVNKYKTISLIRPSESWSFSNLTQKDTNYLTHCYHRYPAKFIPQLARKLILENSKEDEIICDPFYGSGSTILESILHNRIGYGTDINPIAYLITMAKTTPIHSLKLQKEIESINYNLKHTDYDREDYLPEKLSNWFDISTYNTLRNILIEIKKIKPQSVMFFFLCAFSHILKSSSYWNNGSVKPHKIKDKFLNKTNEPISRFFSHVKKMELRNVQFNLILPEKIKNNIDHYRQVQLGDIKNITSNNQCSLIVTSPPYVVSYEYRDIHSLSLNFLQDFFSNIPDHKNFIGSSRRKITSHKIFSDTASAIIEDLLVQDKNLSKTVSSYFLDMQDSFIKSTQLLKTNGRLAVVIGDTTLRGVSISNTQVFAEILTNLGFTENQLIKREIPFKSLPFTRDPETGRFVSSKSSSCIKSYSHEYIMIYCKN